MKDFQWPIPILSHSVQTFGLGTINRITASGKQAQPALEEAARLLGDLDDKLSYYKESSDISKINHNAGGYFQRVSPETYALLKKATDYSRISNGALDLTIRPLTNLWRVDAEHPRIPDVQAIQNARELVNYQDLEFDDQSLSVRLKRPNQVIDVNFIAKGFAADEVQRVLERRRIKSALVDLGGNVYVHGGKPDGTPWRVGIQHPLKPRGEYVGFLQLKDASIVTSGDYEKFFWLNQKRYHHILDPKTGYPVDNGIISVTVLSKQSVDGDALTTCLYVMGVNRGLELVASFNDKAMEALIITADQKLYGTPGMRRQFSLSDDSFSW